MRVYPNYLFNPVHIQEPYTVEKYLFGISSGQEILTPNEYFNIHNHNILDFLSGLFYLSWMPVPIGLGFYFYFTDRKLLLQFSAAFLFANLLGFCLYYLYPAAPPWYYAKYGNAQFFDIPGDAAALVRFDELIGLPIFTNIYTKNANVFAAIPSLHAAYPVIAWYYARKKKLKKVTVLIFINIIGIWFTAVYSFHHYFLDVILGLCCAVVALIIFDGFLIKTRINDWFNKYIKFIDS